MLSTMKVKESNSNSCGENKALAYQILKILELVNEGGKNFINISEKDLIIFIGGTQVGKSTTINALLGVPLQENDDGYIEPIPPNEFVAPVGDGRQNFTELPTLYEKEGFNFCFLDTQGFFEGRGEDLVIASSILMEIAIRKAKSVRVVFLGKMSDLQGGYAELTAKFSEQISRIISNSTAPVFFLWNRYTPQGKANILKFYNPNSSKDEQNKTIMNEIKTKMGTYIKDENARINNIEKELENKYDKINSSKNDKNQDKESLYNEILQVQKKNILYSLVDNSYKHDYYGYIDPTNSDSILNFKKKIEECEAISKCDLVYNQYSQEIVKFKDNFIKLLFDQFSFMKKQIFTGKYLEKNKRTLSTKEHELSSQTEKEIKNINGTISSIIEDKNNKLQKLNEIKDFVKQINRQWENEYIKNHKYNDVIESFKIFIDNLSDNIKGKQTVKQFLELYKRIESSNQIDIKSTHINDILLAYEQIQD